MNGYKLLADAIALFHLGYVAFIVFGLLLILLGGILKWNWVRNLWFRGIHLVMMGIVAVEAMCGVTCPLTIWEYQLRQKAGQHHAGGGFVESLVNRFLFLELPPWVFPILHIGFGALVFGTLFLIPPRLKRVTEHVA